MSDLQCEDVMQGGSTVIYLQNEKLIVRFDQDGMASNFARGVYANDTGCRGGFGPFWTSPAEKQKIYGDKMVVQYEFTLKTSHFLATYKFDNETTVIISDLSLCLTNSLHGGRFSHWTGEMTLVGFVEVLSTE